MTKQNQQNFAAKSMVSGLVVAILLAYVLSFFVENERIIWMWAIPSGIGIGLMAGSLPKMTTGVWQVLGLSGYVLIFIAIASVDYLFGAGSLSDFTGVVMTLVGITAVMGWIMRRHREEAEQASS